MEISIQVLDVDYVPLNGEPLVRIFGKDKNGRSVCAFYKGFLPYFYILPKKDKETLKNKLVKEFKNLIVNIEEVEKFDPIGFSKKKKKFLKITLANPAKVPTVRDYLLENKLIEKAYEADILFKYRFMADFGIFGMRCYTIKGVATPTNTVKTQITVYIEDIKEVKEFWPLHKYLSIDIEVAAGGLPDPKKHPIAIISLAFNPPYRGKKNLLLISKRAKGLPKNCLSFASEKEMLSKLLNIIEEYDPDFIVGYNINDFDLPYILERLRINNLPRNLGRCKEKRAICKKIGNKRVPTVTGRIVVDVFNIIKEAASKGVFRFKRYGLGDVSKELLGEGKVDITHSEITKYWNGGEREFKKLLEYAKKDSELTLRLLLEKNLLDKFIELSKVSGLLLQDVLESGESARIENLLLREFNKHDFLLPAKPTKEEVLKRKEEREAKGLKGGLVLEPKVGLHTEGIIYLDFEAMYPSIFISYNICPTTLVKGDIALETIETPSGAKFVSKKIREGIIPRILRSLIEERRRIKKKLKEEKDEEKRRILDAKQLALKYMANAFYGYTGYLRARLYLLEIANAITSCGRYLISRTKEIVETDKRFKVIYGDTDSIFVKTKEKDLEKLLAIGKELEQRINKQLKGIVRMKIESIFTSLLILSKKRYAGLSYEKIGDEWREKIVMKGIETVRRDWCELTSKTLEKTLEILLRERNIEKAFKFVKDILRKLSEGKVSLKDLVITKTLSKPINEYKGMQPHVELIKKLVKRSPDKVPGIGDRIGYVIVQGPGLVSKRAEDPDYVKEKGLKIDSKYYIESQLLPPLERIFEALGIKRSQLLGVGKQLLIKEIVKGMASKKIVIEEVLEGFEGFSCSRCGKFYRRPPLNGRCEVCNSPVYFFFNGSLGKKVVVS